MKTSRMVDLYLEGKNIGEILKNPEEKTLEGKVIKDYKCPCCGAEGTMKITKIEEEDNNFYKVIATCSSCNEPTELEFVLKDEEFQEEGEENNESITINSRIFEPITESVMTGNYIMFNDRHSYSKNEAGENIISFGKDIQPGSQDIALNSRVTYKVIGFKNNMARIISMVNNNAQKIKAGEIFFVDKNDLQKYAKVATPRQNASLQGRFKY